LNKLKLIEQIFNKSLEPTEAELREKTIVALTHKIQSTVAKNQKEFNPIATNSFFHLRRKSFKEVDHDYLNYLDDYVTNQNLPILEKSCQMFDRVAENSPE
jgi:hypothetical protein